MTDIFFIEKTSSKRIARQIEHYNKSVNTDFTIFEDRGKKIIKKMDEATFNLKFG